MTLNKTTLLFAALIVVSGCTSRGAQQYDFVDQNDKSVTVHTGGGGLNGRLKGILHAKGFRLVVYNGPKVLEGTTGEKTKLLSYDTSNTRYKLLVNSLSAGNCLQGSPATDYDISFIDTKLGSEVFTLNGTACQDQVVEEFTKLLESRH